MVTARKDLENIVGPLQNSSSHELYAKMVLMTIGAINRRLAQPEYIRRTYLDSDRWLPQGLLNVTKKYVNGFITKEEASSELRRVDTEYRQIFSEAGYSDLPQPL